MSDGNTILSVAKAMELLGALSRAQGALTLKELSDRCGFPKSTVFGLLTTMREYDVIAQAPDGKYTLGLRLLELGCQVEKSLDISNVAKPYMELLSQKTGASVMLSICQGANVITLDQVQPHGNLHVVSSTGARLPIHCTSQGKVFLAYRKPQDALKLLKRQPLAAFTPHTITDAAALMQELTQCRENGYAIENGEYKIGLRSISAPVFTQAGEVKYTVGVIGMFRSVVSDEFAVAIEQVMATASMISAALGYRPDRES